MHFKKVFSLAITTGIITGLMQLSAFTPTAYAEKQLKRAHQPIQVQLSELISITGTQSGDPIEAVVIEDHVYKGQVLPAGTVFRGEVEKVRESKHLGRPGFVIFDFNKAKLPNGLVVDIDSTDKKINGPDAMTMQRKAKISSGFVVASMAAKIPLQAATPLAIPVTSGAAFLSKMIYGAAIENVDKWSEHAEWSRGKRTMWGMFRGTGVPGTIHLVKKEENPVFHDGDFVSIELEPETFKNLFELSDQEYQPLLNVNGEIPESKMSLKN